MIHTVPNPKMTVHEVEKFRENFRKCVSGKLTLKEKKAIIHREFIKKPIIVKEK